MRDDTHRYLDGDIPRTALGAEEADEARAWEEMLERADLRALRAPADLEGRVMRSLPEAPALPAWRRALDWLLRPRTVHVRPFTVGLAAAGLAALLVIRPAPRAAAPEAMPGAGVVPAAGTAATPPARTVYVQFTLTAQSARSVAVAGDFNGWNTSSHLLRDADGDGVWTGMVPVSPGVHKYMFVIDDDRWTTDPNADRHIDDGFGMRNALITVAPPPRGRSS